MTKHKDEVRERKLWIRSKPLIWGMVGSCYLILLYFFGPLDASLAMLFIATAIGISGQVNLSE
jgi:hypothetical protein